MQTYQIEPRPAQGPVLQGKSVVTSGTGGAAAGAILHYVFGVEPERSAAIGAIAMPVLAGIGTAARDYVHRDQPSGLWGALWRLIGAVL